MHTQGTRYSSSSLLAPSKETSKSPLDKRGQPRARTDNKPIELEAASFRLSGSDPPGMPFTCLRRPGAPARRPLLGADSRALRRGRVICNGRLPVNRWPGILVNAEGPPHTFPASDSCLQIVRMICCVVEAGAGSSLLVF